ncbi:hypothetical protein I3J14_34165, partial [Streptomyces sp. HB-N217]|nr:hypothetical protein [Streptomyces sp. HB-N217]
MSATVKAARAAGPSKPPRLYQQVQHSSEQFQRLLLPRLPDLRPFTAGAAYRPASAPTAV